MNKCCINRIFAVAAFLVILSSAVKAQNYEFPLLERIVTINAENKTVESILDEISHQAGFIFSYNPDVINAYNLVTYKAENKPVRFVLTDILDKSIAFREVGQYVILQSEKGFKEKRLLEGYLYDSRTGERISNASIYDKTLMKSAVTDRYGYFSIELSPLSDSTSFKICKTGYADTLIAKASFNKSNRMLELMMNKIDNGVDSVRSKFPARVPPWLVPKNIWSNSVNIRESWSRAVQLSLVPGLGTNRLLGGNIDNHFSLNIIGGYTRSVDILELGGVFNIVQTDAGYCQVGGVCNFTGGTSKGIQISGLYNSASVVKGAQVSGGINVSKGRSDVQVAGIANKSLDTKIQLAGIAGYATRSADVQVSGIVNYTDSSYVQVAGLANISGFSKVLQAGLVNISDSTKGVTAGLVNISGNSEGVNIGIFNFIKNGYHTIELSADELLFINLAYRSGTRKFHSIVTTSWKDYGPYYGIWGLGYGIGTSLGRSERLFYDIEATSKALFYREGLSRSDCQIHTLYTGIDKRVARNISVAAGVTFNLQVVYMTNLDHRDDFMSLSPYSLRLIEDTRSDNFYSWFGAKVALRFF